MEELIAERKKAKGVHLDIELSGDDWKELVGEFKARVKKETGKDFPEDPNKQLWEPSGRSLNPGTPLGRLPTAVEQDPGRLGHGGQRADHGLRQYGWRERHRVAFTRDPATGKKFFSENFLPNAQGEDVVAGIRTPNRSASPARATRPCFPWRKPPQGLPGAGKDLPEIGKHFRDMQDIEFTVQEESSGCSKRARESGQPLRPFALPWRWSRKD